MNNKKKTVNLCYIKEQRHENKYNTMHDPCSNLEYKKKKMLKDITGTIAET